MNRKTTTHGFTLVEIIVVVAIMGIIVATSSGIFENIYRESALRAGGGEVYGALVSARSQTLASQDDMVYGVFVSSTTVTRFEGGTYIAGVATNKVYAFEGGVTATSSIITAGVPVVFTRLSGESSVQGTIYVRNRDGTGTTTIVIHSSGLVEYD